MTLPPEILAILREQERQLARVNPAHRKKLMLIGETLGHELERALRRLAPGKKYSTAQIRTVLAQAKALVEVIGARYGQDVAAVIVLAHRQGARRGRQSLAEQLAIWDAEGLLPIAIRVEPAGALLDPGLLELHETSVEAYGGEKIAKMRMTLARGQLANETVVQTAERLKDDVSILDWQAERIVRTEHSFALHRRQRLDLKEIFGPEADKEFGKQLIAVFDDRTGDDSKYVHLQVRRLDEEFEDNEGRHYQHPPNRPNDRETVVFVPMALVRRFDELSWDPSVKKRRDREGSVALGVDRAGLVEGLVRDPSGKADFFDKNGQAWDVKSFNSYPKPRKGGYTLKGSIQKIQDSLKLGENVIVDTATMRPEHVIELRAEVQRRSLSGVVWFP